MAEKPASPRGRPKPRVNRAERQADYVRIAAQTFQELGLHRASMQDVADRAGVAKILVYRQFPSREALLTSVFQSVLDELGGIYAQPWSGYGAGLLNILRRARRSRAAYLLLLRDSRADPVFHPWFDLYEEGQITALTPFLEPEPGCPPGAEGRARLAARMLVGIITETLINCLLDRDGLTDEERAQWFGAIAREWRRASRTVYRLRAPEAPSPPAG